MQQLPCRLSRALKLLWTKVEETYTDEIKKAFAEPLTAEETHRLESGGGH